MALDISDETQRHSGARLVLDAHDFGAQMQRFFTWEVEIDVRGRTGLELPRRAHEQAVP
jgi:hypothetical protein